MRAAARAFRFVLFLLAMINLRYASSKELAQVADPAVQERITRAVESSFGPKFKPMEHFQAVALLYEDARDHEKFVPELFWWCCARARQGHFIEAEPLAVMRLVAILDVSRAAMAKVAAPHVFAEDKSLRQTARLFLRVVENSEPPSTPDFSRYVYLLRPDPPLPLIRYMYERSPGTALLTLAGVYLEWPERKDVIGCEHSVTEAIWKQRFERTKEMDAGIVVGFAKLSRHDAWWVRLYVAEIMRQHPAFRTPELVKRLKDDPHTLIRDAMDFARQKPKETPKTPAGAAPPAVEPPPRERK